MFIGCRVAVGGIVGVAIGSGVEVGKAVGIASGRSVGAKLKSIESVAAGGSKRVWVSAGPAWTFWSPRFEEEQARATSSRTRNESRVNGRGIFAIVDTINFYTFCTGCPVQPAGACGVPGRLVIIRKESKYG
jgi:hypothetical protein